MNYGNPGVYTGTGIVNDLHMLSDVNDVRAR